jgi:hypothetical protein
MFSKPESSPGDFRAPDCAVSRPQRFPRPKYLRDEKFFPSLPILNPSQMAKLEDCLATPVDVRTLFKDIVYPATFPLKLSAPMDPTLF